MNDFIVAVLAVIWAFSYYKLDLSSICKCFRSEPQIQKLLE